MLFSSYYEFYNNQINARALIGHSAMIFCASKLTYGKIASSELLEILRSRLSNLTTIGKPRFAVSGFTLAVCPYLGLKIHGLNSQLPCLFSFVRSLLF